MSEELSESIQEMKEYQSNAWEYVLEQLNQLKARVDTLEMKLEEKQ